MSKINMIRRSAMKAAGVFAITPLSACGGGTGASGSSPPGAVTPVAQTFIMPDEGGTHTATWMAYGATANAWGTAGIYGASRSIARMDLMRIAANLSRYELVNLLVANQADLSQAQQFLSQVRREPTPSFSGTSALPAIEAAAPIKFIVLPLDDLWMRDTGPVFVRDNQRMRGSQHSAFLKQNVGGVHIAQNDLWQAQNKSQKNCCN
ncbi:agmatine deiminase family protein [Undibacterium sp. SXout11W]|uniref:agmatine deiminase family protein n=1 Tax=Undibacterium sp. SXout11W TaxID=3413050 RepID=UPI003BF07C3C